MMKDWHCNDVSCHSTEPEQRLIVTFTVLLQRLHPESRQQRISEPTPLLQRQGSTSPDKSAGRAEDPQETQQQTEDKRPANKRLGPYSVACENLHAMAETEKEESIERHCPWKLIRQRSFKPCLNTPCRLPRTLQAISYRRSSADVNYVSCVLVSVLMLSFSPVATGVHGFTTRMDVSKAQSAGGNFQKETL